MTTALLTLARAYASLPGAPKMDPDHDGWTLARGLFRAAPTGILWRRGGDGWLPDLTGRGTGGVLLAALPDAYHLHRDGDLWTFHDKDGVTVGTGATLAEAVARVAVAVGRAA